MLLKMQDIGEILFGSYQKPNNKNGVRFLQASHFDDLNEPTLLEGSFVIPEPKEYKSILQSNDVVLAGKGSKIFAWAYKESYGEVLPSSIFFIIRPKKNIIGKYLAYNLNSEKILFKLKSLGAGVTVTSISKKDLLKLELWIPSLKKQKEIIGMIDLIKKNIRLTTELLNEKENLKRGLINNLIQI